jgi:hypothetical protein
MTANPRIFLENATTGKVVDLGKVVESIEAIKEWHKYIKLKKKGKK